MVTRTKKIFVGGLSAPSTVEDVRNYFGQFGKVNINKLPSKLFLTVYVPIQNGGSNRKA